MLQKLRRTNSLLAGITLSCLAANSAADTIELRASDWCPYICSSEANQGLLVEIATQIFSEAGHEVSFRTMPWTRALREVQHHHANGLVGVTPVEAPSLLYGEVPILHSEDHWFVKADNPWRYETLSSLDNKSLGATEGYSYGKDIDNYIDQHRTNNEKIQLQIGEVSLLRNIRKLQRGKIDVLIEDCRVVTQVAHTRDKDINLISAGLASRIALYIGFATDHPKSKAYVKVLNDGAKKMIDDGSLAQMLARYPATLCHPNR